jgi:hypothetical protein
MWLAFEDICVHTYLLGDAIGYYTSRNASKYA